MSNTPIQVSTDLSKALEQIARKLDDLQKDVTGIRVELAEVKTEVKGLKEDIKEIKGSQKAQIWTLIGVLGTAVLGTVIRFVITALPNSNP